MAQFLVRRRLQRNSAQLRATREELATCQSAAIIKVGRHFAKVKQVLSALDLITRQRPGVIALDRIFASSSRGAAMTQGMALPKIARFQSGFLRMRVLCGSTEVMPIHPFRIERQVSETTAVWEGLYVFDPAALGGVAPRFASTMSSARR